MPDIKKFHCAMGGYVFNLALTPKQACQTDGDYVSHYRFKSGHTHSLNLR